MARKKSGGTSLREAAEVFLALPLPDGAAREALAARGVRRRELVNGMAVVAGMADAAAGGDVRAAKWLVEVGAATAAGAGDEAEVKILDDV